MPVYRVAEVATLLDVSDDTVRRWIDTGRLPVCTARRSGPLAVDGRDVAALALELAAGPTGDRLHTVSARNRFPGLVTRVLRDTVMTQVDIQAGPHRVVSIISSEAADDMGLEPGVAVTAVVKATEIVLDTTGGR